MFKSTAELLAALNSPHNTTRKAAEQAFLQQQASNAEALAQELLNAVGAGATLPEPSRVMAAVLARRFTAPMTCRSDAPWAAAVVASFREALCAKMLGEASPLVARQLCHAVASEASAGAWPEVLQMAGDALGRDVPALEAGDASRAQSARICLSLARALVEADAAGGDAGAEALSPLLARYCGVGDGETSTLAVRAACALGARASAKARKATVGPQLCGPCLAATQKLLEAGDEARAVECFDALVDVAADGAAFFAKLAGDLARLVGAAANADAFEATTRGRALEVALALCEAAPALARRNAAVFVQSLVPVAVGLSRAVEDDAAAAWAGRPCELAPLGERDDESDHAKAGDDALKRLCGALGKQVAPALLEFCGQAFGSASWVDARCGLAALNALALGAPKELKPHVATAAAVAAQTIAAPASDPRCVVEACRLVGALSMATKEAYQRACSENEIPSPVPALAAALADAARSPPRVAGALCAALSVFASAGEDDGGDPAYVEAHLDAVVPALASTLARVGGDANAQKATLDAVATVASCAEGAFGPYYGTFMPTLLAALDATADRRHVDQIAAVRARAIDCAAVVGSAVGVDAFAADAPKVLAAIAGDLGAAGPQQGGDDVDADLPLSVLLPAAVSVVKTCGGAAVDAYLEAIAAPLLAAATAVPQISHAPNVGGDDSGRKEEDGTYSVVMGDLRITVDLRALWAKEKASDLLGELADACGDCLPSAAAVKFAEALAPLSTFVGSESVRSTASLSLGQVVGAAVARLRKHPGEPGLLESAGALAAAALRTVLDAAQKETADDARPMHVQAVADVLEHVGQSHPGGLEAGLAAARASGGSHAPLGRFLDDAYLDALAQALLTLATASTQRRDAIEKDLANDDAYDAQGEDADVLQEAVESEEALQTNVVNALGWALKLKRDAFATSTFASRVAPYYGPKIQAPDPAERDLHAALCVFVDVVDHAPAAPAAAQAAPLVLAMSLKILSQGLGGADLRATAAYAVAVVSRSPLGEELVRSTTQNNPQAAADLLRSVADAAPRPEDDDDDDPDAAARVAENAANAVKAIVDAVYGTAAPERAPLLGWWLAKLPLKADDEEARRAHKDLASLVESRDAALFGDAANVSTAAARLADALADYEENGDTPSKPPAAQLDASTAPRAARALKSLNADHPASVQAAYAGLAAPAQAALQKACTA